MDILIFQILIPFFLSSFVVIIVMYIAEKFGSKVGGIFGTLPSTIIIAFAFIAYTEGVEFSSEAAAIVPAELGVNIIFLLIFTIFVKKSSLLAFILSFFVWTMLTLLLLFFHINEIIVSILFYVFCLVTGFLVLEKIIKIPSIGKIKIHYTFNKIIARGILAGIVIAIAVVLSNIGSIISGIFSVFPAILSSTMFISLKEHGANFAAGMAKSMILGISSVAMYATVIHFLYPLYGIIVGSIIAFFLSFIVTLCIFFIRKKIL